jgi:hypothetical protein
MIMNSAYKLLVAFVFFCAVLFGGYFLYQSYLPSTKLNLPTNQAGNNAEVVESKLQTGFTKSIFSSVQVENATGKLYMSTAKKGDLLLEPYVIDLDTSRVYQENTGTVDTSFYHKINNTGTGMIFVGTTKDDLTEAFKSGKFSDAFHLYKSEAPTVHTIPLLSESKKVFTSKDMDKRSPALSGDSTRVLYVADSGRKSKLSSPNSIDKYDIHIVDINKSTDNVIARGTYPQWIDDKSFAFISANGVEIYSLTTQKSKVLINDTNTEDNYKLSIDKKGKLVALCVPNTKKVFLYEFDEAKTSLAFLNQIEVLGFWAIFSPDSKFLAVQTVSDQNNLKSSPKISFFDPRTGGGLKQEIDLSGFDNQKLFVTEWKK